MLPPVRLSLRRKARRVKPPITITSPSVILGRRAGAVSKDARRRTCAIAPTMTDKTQTPAEKMKAILAKKQGGLAAAGQANAASGGKKGERNAAAASMSKSKPALRK